MNGTRMKGSVIAVALAATLGLGWAVLATGVADAADRIGGEFALERVDLRFAGGEKVRVLAAGQEARAEAEITFAGAGQLGGAWEIAEATTTAGSPQFRTLELVSRLLGAGRRELLSSPPLPTAAPGIYLLRLRITAPTPEIVGGDQPLRYFVGSVSPDPAGKAGIPETLVVRDPLPGVPPEGRTFSWEPVAGCIAYQVEFYEKDAAAAAITEAGGPPGAALISIPSRLGRPPVTGVMAPVTQSEVALGPLAAARLVAGRSYLWRVVGLGKDGNAVCESPLKEIAW